jgi:octopine/nopaline transport system permease protein
MNLQIDLILESIPKMLAGIGVTFQLLFLAAFLGLCLGVILLVMRISGRWYLSFPAFIFIYFFRGTPILVQIFVIYHGFPSRPTAMTSSACSRQHHWPARSL